MGLALIAVAAIAWWLHRRGELMPNLVRYGGLAVIGLLAYRLLTSGRTVAAVLVVAGGWAWWMWNQRGGSGRFGSGGELARASRLLNVPANAPSEVVWQAWRQAMTTAHPDAGGTSEAAQSLTAARDLLINAAEKRRDSTD